MSVVRKSLVFSSATFISRLGGLLRDVSLAAVYGASRMLDAYFVSIVVPFFFRKVFGEGALSSSFVPAYKRAENRDVFVSSVLNSLGIVTTVIVALIEIFPGTVASIFSPGLTKEIVVPLVRVSALMIPLIFLWAVFYSILNSHGRFFLPALSPVLMNLGVIAGTLLGKSVLWSIWGFVLGGTAAAAILGIEASRYFRYRFTMRGFSGYAPNFLKATLAVMANQLNLLVDTAVSSMLGEGAVSAVQLASRLYQLPMGLFVVAVSTVSLVEMSERDARRESFDASLYLALPSAVGLFALSEGIVRLVYSFGRFSGNAVDITGETLRMYSIGLVFYAVYSVALRYHHAKGEMNVPLISSFIVSGVNIVLDFPLGFSMGPSGVALATSLAGMAGTLFFWMRKEMILDRVELMKMLFASTLVGTSAWILGKGGGRTETILAVILGVVIYVLLSIALKIRAFSEITRRSR